MITTLTDNAKAALLIMLGMTLLSSNDAIMKLSSETLGIGQMLFIRGLIAVAIFSLALRINGKPIIADVVISKWIVVRALCECGGTICFITGLSLLPIATASTLVWTSPIFLTIAAALILRERVTPARWWAVLVGFTGVVLVTNPGSADFSLAMLLPLATAIFICFRDMVTRKIDPSHHSLYVTWTTLVTVTAAGLLISFFDWRPADVVISKWIVVRALCECGGTICFITGLSLLPIATASTLVWTSPIFLTIAAALILRERVTPARWWAVLVGFTGVVLVTNPGSADFSLAMLLPLATAIFICFRDMVTRKIDPSHHSLYVTWTTLVTVTAAGLLISFFDWRPIAVTQIVWLGASAILMSLAFFIQITAVRLGELSFIAPFAYSGILIAVFYGAVVWGELPGVPTIIGIVLIVLSGLFILSHQTRSPTKGAPAVSD